MWYAGLTAMVVTNSYHLHGWTCIKTKIPLTQTAEYSETGSVKVERKMKGNETQIKAWKGGKKNPCVRYQRVGVYSMHHSHASNYCLLCHMNKIVLCVSFPIFCPCTHASFQTQRNLKAIQLNMNTQFCVLAPFATCNHLKAFFSFIPVSSFIAIST